jgi:hypothetical protein
MEHRPISSSPTSVRKLEEVAQDHGLNGAPAEPFSSTYVTALEKEMALSRGWPEQEAEMEGRGRGSGVGGGGGMRAGRGRGSCWRWRWGANQIVGGGDNQGDVNGDRIRAMVWTKRFFREARFAGRTTTKRIVDGRIRNHFSFFK